MTAGSGPFFDVRTTPFSHPGSWLSVSPVLGEGAVARDVHVTSHRNGTHPLFAIVPMHCGARADAEVTAEPAGLTWTHAAGGVELVFVGPDTLRLRGWGLGVQLRVVAEKLTPRSGTYAFADPSGRFVFTSYETGHRYGVTVIEGHAVLHGDQQLGASERAVLIDDGQPWELELVEYRSGVPTAASITFDDAKASAASAFRCFADSIAPAADGTASLAAYVLWSAIVAPDGFVRRPAVLMSKHWMDKAWAWDPCFNAIALATGQPDLAVDQFLLVFDHQDGTGALPDSVAHSEVLFNFVKPPVHGWAFERLRERLSRPLSPAELVAVYEPMSRWSDFWLDHRRAPGSALCYYEHGNDSGWDNASTFDGERLVESADLAALLILQLRTLGRLAAELGDDAAAHRRDAQAAELVTAMLKLWDGTRFRARGAASRRWHTSASLLDLVPIVLGDLLPTEIRTALIAAAATHLTAYGLATEQPLSSSYVDDGYWRGPVWAPSTVLLTYGLDQAGARDLARSAAVGFRRACALSGFAENFDARTGAGLRDRAYTWTAAGYLILAGAASSA